jgi:hypothetical protein
VRFNIRDFSDTSLLLETLYVIFFHFVIFHSQPETVLPNNVASPIWKQTNRKGAENDDLYLPYQFIHIVILFVVLN